MQKYGSKLLDSVPNPFFGIITDPLVPLSAPTVQLGQLLKAWPQYSGVVPIRLETVGLDRSVPRRGLAVTPPGTADRLVGTPGIRVLKPIGARLRGEG